MASYWLTPIMQREPLILGKDRMLCNHPDMGEFREKLQAIHPRCLMMIKANIIPDDENNENDDGLCGTYDSEVPYANQEELHFNDNWGVSHCAQAFLDHLPVVNELQASFNQDSLGEQEWTNQQLVWLNKITEWHACQLDVILIREE